MKIRLENITKVFQNKKKIETVAVNDFSIELESGKLIGLLGPSGCGKSTTLYMISGLLNPTEGRIYFDDEDVTDISPEHRGIGLVFQNYALYPHMTVAKNIMFPLENLKVPKEEAYERAYEMAELVGIGELMNRKPRQLSGGQQQRVAIARALVKKPRVLLLDEPLSNLDARLRLQTREEIKRIQRETGITTVFVTHDQEEAMSISDQIVLMDLGVKQQVGKPQEVYDKPDNLFVAKFLGTPPINVFEGEIKKKSILFNNVEIAETKLKNQEVIIGIRPEGFLVDTFGPLGLEIVYVETIGRDTTLIVKNPISLNEVFELEMGVDHGYSVGDTIKANIKDGEYILKETGNRSLEVVEIVDLKTASVIKVKDPQHFDTFRVIVESDQVFKPGEVVHFSVKPNKLHIFNKETKEVL